ncbi:unnamed protein product [Phytophthora fragariaefolia]|uniref:Unnamed protein product n=1 Tax=Phytophthora fragariaefolia TaxID=1490495 RepID=A0A9W6Y5M3_9STRA|nr:unnamed protein product [Phytophthora fragariaefolia]
MSTAHSTESAASEGDASAPDTLQGRVTIRGEEMDPSLWKMYSSPNSTIYSTVTSAFCPSSKGMATAISSPSCSCATASRWVAPMASSDLALTASSVTGPLAEALELSSMHIARRPRSSALQAVSPPSISLARLIEPWLQSSIVHTTPKPVLY